MELSIESRRQKMEREAEEAWGNENFREWAQINKEIQAISRVI